MNTIYLQLGSNKGDRRFYLNQAEKQINKKIGRITSSSDTYESTPWGIKNQNKFLNKVIAIKSHLTSKRILNLSQEIEKKIGRVKSKKWEERIIDIDILFYNDDIVRENNLIIPHPLIQERLFVLIPLSEIAANLMHPVYKKDIHTLISECKDIEKVEKYEL